MRQTRTDSLLTEFCEDAERISMRAFDSRGLSILLGKWLEDHGSRAGDGEIPEQRGWEIA